ncbi:phosphoglycerate dehydrogenase [Desulfurispira natronophila]|uniref:D-3-phosphoglycerate dehydrogenase n=1 Tax=Desulfurispira natronophila TaxID=682562 RepID=A0A7W7Y6A3_9BACT|nr:phosphoglycerate dehydrogenase [Desulfurispira natronophila]MBB5022900.1 D-3-phosphoglycerate dehydrogenase [Desulfurispira natronophila]
MSQVLVTTVPFGDRCSLPIELLEENGISFVINPLNRKLKEEELAELVGDFEVLIAGTEVISDRVMANGRNLRLISRVGVGLDGVDLAAARHRGIQVSYTPDAPAPAVADLSIGLIMSLLRCTHLSNLHMHRGLWNRYFGKRIQESTVGIIGAGRIGMRVLHLLVALGVKRLLVHDTDPAVRLRCPEGVEWVSRDVVLEESDAVSIHVPLTGKSRNMIARDELLRMKSDAVIVNTSRGGIIHEDDLADVLEEGYLGGAAVDVFTNEPYSGRLCEVERCLLTSHMGSMSVDCRTQMEIEATREAVRFLTGQALESTVPELEYEIQRLAGS